MKSVLLAAVAAGLLAAVAPASALTIGDIEVKSALGERFDARIPLTLQAGEDVVQGCVRLDAAAASSSGAPHLGDYTLTVDPVQAGKSGVRLATSRAMSEPVVRVHLVIRCGQKTSSSREFVINQKLAVTKK